MKKIILVFLCLIFGFTNVKALDVKESMASLADYAVYLKDNYNLYFYYDSSSKDKIKKLETFKGSKTFEHNNKCLFVMGKLEFISFVFNNATGLMNNPDPSYLDIFLLSYNNGWIYKSEYIEKIKSFNSKSEFNLYELFRGDIIGFSSNGKYDLYIYNGNDNFITITNNYPNSISYVNRNNLFDGDYSVFRIIGYISRSLERNKAYKTSVVLNTRKSIDFSENYSCITKTNFTDSNIYKQIKKVYLIIMITIMLIINILNYLAVKDEMDVVKERGIVSIVFRTIVFLILISLPFILESIVKLF